MASDPLGDTGFMRRAMALAREGDRKPGANPIGCVIVLDGAIIGEGYNEVDICHDPTSHAEIVAMRRAGEKLRQSEFRGATLYSTLQPCGMCTMASIWAKIGRIVYGAERDQVHSMYFEDRHLDAVMQAYEQVGIRVKIDGPQEFREHGKRAVYGNLPSPNIVETGRFTPGFLLLANEKVFAT